MKHMKTLWLTLCIAILPASAFAQGWVPTPRGGTTVVGGGGGITCPVGDLSTGCYVQSIRGANNAGGAVPLGSGAYLTSATGSNSYIDLTAANASYGYAKFLNYVYAPSLNYSGTLSFAPNGGSAALTLDTSTYAGFTHLATSSNGFYLNSGAAIYFVSGSGLIYLDGQLQIQNPGNGNPVWTWSDNDTALATQTAAASTAGLQIGQATQNSATPPSNFVVKPQFQSGSDEGSSAANTPASFVVDYGAPYTTSNPGQEAGFAVERNGVFVGSIQGWTSSPTSYGTLYLGPGITPSGTNYTILSDGTANTYFNSPGSSGQIHFQIANTDYYEMAKTYFAPATDNAYANGTNGARWQYTSTGPTGFLVYHAQGDATALARMYDNGGVPSLLFGAAGSSPLISQSTQTSDIAPNDLTIQSQGPFASASTHKSPGNVVFNTPAPVSGGTTGYTYFETGGTKIAAFGTYNNGTSTGTLYLGSPAAAPSLSNWSIYNNGGGATVFNATSVIYYDIASTGYLQLALTPSTMFGPVGDLGVNNGLTTNRWNQVLAGSNGFSVYSGGVNSASADPTSQLGSAALSFGPGSATADTRLARAASGAATLDNAAGGDATLDIGGGTSGNQITLASASTPSIDVTAGSSSKTINFGPTNATALAIGNSSSTSNILGNLHLHGQNIPAGVSNGQVWQFDGTNWQLVAGSSLGPGAVTWADDLSGSTNSAQYVGAISGPGGVSGPVNINGASTTLNWVTNSVTLQSASTTRLFLGGGNGDYINLGGNGGSNGFLRCTSGRDCLDSPGGLDIGTLGTSGIAIGNTSTNASIGLTVDNSGTILHTIGGANVLFQGSSTGDYISLGNNPGSVGYVRCGSNASCIGVNGTAILGTDSTPNAYINTPTSQLAFEVAGLKTAIMYSNDFSGNGNGVATLGGNGVWGTSYFAYGSSYSEYIELATLSNNPEILFSSGVQSGATNGAGIGWTGANTVGQGMNVALIGQQGDSGFAGGQVTIASGAGTNDGGIVFGFNLTQGGSISDKVQFVGASSSATRGDLQWSSAITPEFTQSSQAVHNANATDWTIAPQQNTDATSTSGRSGALLVNLSAPPNTSTVESYLDVQRALVDTVSLGPYPGAPTAGGVWLSTSYAGANESASNFSLYGDSTQTIINSPSKTQFRVGNTSVTNLQTSGWGGDASTHNFKWNPTTVSVGTGGTITISQATLATAPFITLTDTGTTTSQIVLDFSNSGNQQGSFWIIDTFGISFGASLGISVKYGTTTEVVTSVGAPTGNMFTVALDGAANRILWH